MRTAIRKHLGDFVALTALAVLGVGVAAYIVFNQDARSRIPLIEEKPFTIQAEFSDAQAVTPGQGQTVRIAGVRVGQITKINLRDGRAIVTLDLERKYEGRIRQNASALLRPRTGLKDMFVELDPGTRDHPAMKARGLIPVENTAPDIDPDEVLSALDTDTREYLKLLVSGAGKGLRNRGDDLREVFRRFEPLHRDLARVNRAIADRRRNLARLIHNYASLTTELGRNDRDLTRLVDASNATLAAFAAEDQNISETVRRLPSALTQTESTLIRVNTLGRVLGPALESLRPPFRQLDRTNRQVLPFVLEAEPILRSRIRPFVRISRPYVRDLRRASVDLARAQPELSESFHELNRFFNMLAFNPGGRQGLSGNLQEDRQRDEGYLFWVAWVGHLTNNLFSTSDASGPFRRVLFSVNCRTAFELTREAGIEVLDNVLGFIRDEALRDAGVCPDVAR